jgi:hypothetical protein
VPLASLFLLMLLVRYAGAVDEYDYPSGEQNSASYAED